MKHLPDQMRNWSGRCFLEAVCIGGGRQMDEGFSRGTRTIFAGILDVLQENITKSGAKRPGQTAFNAPEYSFSGLNRSEERRVGKEC